MAPVNGNNIKIIFAGLTVNSDGIWKQSEQIVAERLKETSIETAAERVTEILAARLAKMSIEMPIKMLVKMPTEMPTAGLAGSGCDFLTLRIFLPGDNAPPALREHSCCS